MQPHYVASLKRQVEGCVGVQAAQNCPSGGGNVPYCNACQNCQNGGRSNINLQGARELREQPFDWESIEDMGAPLQPSPTQHKRNVPNPVPCPRRSPHPLARPPTLYATSFTHGAAQCVPCLRAPTTTGASRSSLSTRDRTRPTTHGAKAASESRFGQLEPC